MKKNPLSLNDQTSSWGRIPIPVWVTLVFSLAVVLWAVANAAWDPLVLANIGTRFSEGDPNGTEGYDGQFVYYIARYLKPDIVAPMIDIPAYRYQRILLPLLAWALSFGGGNWLPWVVPLIVISAHVLGTWAVCLLLQHYRISQWYALVYGLWPGFLFSIRLDLAEPLAFGLIAWAMLLSEQGKHSRSWVFYSLALFAKEVTVVFLGAQLLIYLWTRQWKYAIRFSLVGFLPFFIFQIWLVRVFGTLGLGVGGNNATTFEWIPYYGLLRLGTFNTELLILYLIVFGPSIILPSLWGIYASVKSWFAGNQNVVTMALLFNAFLIPIMPFSTFVEPTGLLRFGCGLVLTVLIFAARNQKYRILNYSFLWLVLNVFFLFG